VRVVHHGQSLALGFEAGDHLIGVHAEPDDLQGDSALDRMLLFGLENGSEASLPDALEDLVGADLLSRAIGWRPLAGLRFGNRRVAHSRLLAAASGRHKEKADRQRVTDSSQTKSGHLRNHWRGSASRTSSAAGGKSGVRLERHGLAAARTLA
jgi:hypothetical protein